MANISNKLGRGLRKKIIIIPIGNDPKDLKVRLKFFIEILNLSQFRKIIIN